MNTTTDPPSARFLQPALYGGLVIGVLSALPIVAAGNVCCCLWVVSGGVVAAYALHQDRRGGVTPADGAFVGFLAGLAGAVVYVLLSIPLTIMLAPIEQALLQRIVQNGNLPPQFREYAATPVRPSARVILGFIFMVFAGAIFATIGGCLTAVVLGRRPANQTPDGSAA